ncbi:hypothetical protein [Roseovarius sp.]|uniref:hypothetical protein n=1 Tax=Roseovarius sp. TaxID=1486281 RepID=UPI003BA968B3
MKLGEVGEGRPRPEYETLMKIVMAYREFVGTKAAFHVEHEWWPGQFSSKNEEMEFYLDEFARPDDYQVIEQWHDQAVEELATCEVDLMEVRRARNLWRFTALVLLIPYLILWYFWRSNT